MPSKMNPKVFKGYHRDPIYQTKIQKILDIKAIGVCVTGEPG